MQPRRRRSRKLEATGATDKRPAGVAYNSIAMPVPADSRGAGGEPRRPARRGPTTTIEGRGPDPAVDNGCPETARIAAHCDAESPTESVTVSTGQSQAPISHTTAASSSTSSSMGKDIHVV